MREGRVVGRPKVRRVRRREAKTRGREREKEGERVREPNGVPAGEREVQDG